MMTDRAVHAAVPTASAPSSTVPTVAPPITTPASTARPLVFIGAFPCSGTHLLRDMLKAAGGVTLAGEMPGLPAMAARWSGTIPSDQVPQALADLRRLDVLNALHPGPADRPDIEPALRVPRKASLGDLLWVQLPGAGPWKGTATPQNTEHFGTLAALFPAARFILLTRDARDVALSWRRRWGKSPVWAAHKWAVRLDRGLDALGRLPRHHWLTLRYEDLLRNPLAELNSIRMMLDLEPLASLPDGPLCRVRAANTSKWQSGLRRRTVQRIEEVALQTMLRIGYTPTFARSPHPFRRHELAFSVVRDVVAAIVIGRPGVPPNRMRDRLGALASAALLRWRAHRLTRRPTPRLPPDKPNPDARQHPTR